MRSERTRLYRVKAVAEMFDVSVSTIYRAIESGELFALKIGGGKGAVRVPEWAIVAFEESCAARAEADLAVVDLAVELAGDRGVTSAGTGTTGDVVSGEVA
jgi:excisionase family DNA binding protein